MTPDPRTEVLSGDVWGNLTTKYKDAIVVVIPNGDVYLISQYLITPEVGYFMQEYDYQFVGAEEGMPREPGIYTMDIIEDFIVPKKFGEQHSVRIKVENVRKQEL